MWWRMRRLEAKRAPSLAPRLGRAAAAIFVSLALLAGAGCRLGGGSGYFPLNANWTWRYTMVSEIKKIKKERTEMVVANLGATMLEDQKVVPRIYEDGHRYYYADHDDGIVLVADRSVGSKTAAEEPGQFVLKHPLEPGTTWPVSSQTYLLRRQIFSPTAVIMVPITVPIPMTYTIESKEDVVRVAAGTFRNCLRVHGKATATRNLGERIGDGEVVVDVVEWFAPGVGLIKMVRSEETRPDSIPTGTMTMELQSLNTGSWFD